MAQCRRKEWILESVRSEFKSQPWPLGAVGNWARHGLSQSLGLASGGGSIATLLLEAPGRGPGPARVNCVAGGGLGTYDFSEEDAPSGQGWTGLPAALVVTTLWSDSSTVSR